MCHHQFCFVYMVPWENFYADAGCPMYGDPNAGYDGEGFELTERAIHIHTTQDGEGYDRTGRNDLGEHDLLRTVKRLRSLMSLTLTRNT
jgi:hypothetical protein